MLENVKYLMFSHLCFSQKQTFDSITGQLTKMQRYSTHLPNILHQSNIYLSFDFLIFTGSTDAAGSVKNIPFMSVYYEYYLLSAGMSLASVL